MNSSISQRGRRSSAARVQGEADVGDEVPNQLEQWLWPTACQGPWGEALEAAAAGAGRELADAGVGWPQFQGLALCVRSS
eukprot:3126547-Pyramimonas_sp.AAC.1